jgi:hypothetical protein
LNASGLDEDVFITEVTMKKMAIVLATVATLAVTAASSPAEPRGWGPGIGFGIAAGALAAGAYGVYGPYGAYGPFGYGRRYMA